LNIIYVSSTCSREKYTQYVESRGARVSQQAQKYNLLLAEGLSENGAKVRLISSRPINRSISKQIFFRGEKEQKNGVSFCYIPVGNLKLLRELSVFFGVFFRILFAGEKKKDTAVCCDALNIAASMGALAGAFLRGFRTLGIVTDVPCHRPSNQKVPFHEKLNLSIMKRFGSYLLLTRQMSQVVNPKNRPFIVLEGHADMSMQAVENRLEDKAEEKICLYAGSLRRIYGIENLVRGFLAADVPNAQLHIYGNGDYAEDLKKLAQEHPNVKYFGIAPNSEVVKAELKATLLVNPRPTNEDYTQYSFPSKNMEYMASGTPVLTTRLPGMPQDHEPYVYFIREESAEGIRDALSQVLSNDRQTLHTFGLQAKEFILQEKNNHAQAAKVLQMLEKA